MKLHTRQMHKASRGEPEDAWTTTTLSRYGHHQPAGHTAGHRRRSSSQGSCVQFISRFIYSCGIRGGIDSRQANAQKRIRSMLSLTIYYLWLNLLTTYPTLMIQLSVIILLDLLQRSLFSCFREAISSFSLSRLPLEATSCVIYHAIDDPP